MKKSIKFVLAALLVVLCCSFVVGCNSVPSKEEIAYQMICYVAEDYEEEPSNITLKSGQLEYDENGNYSAYFKVYVGSYTMYFSGTYYIESGAIEYEDNTYIVELSLTLTGVGAGPKYLDTESFDIADVNNRLKNT